MAEAAAFVTELIPALFSKQKKAFNTLAVLRHGTHEKNLSNLFAWMLDPNESHGFGNLFLDIFVKQVNADRSDRLKLAHENISATGQWKVLQERNTALPGKREDKADIALHNGKTAFVIENYYQSDGHGHSFENYLGYGKDLIGVDRSEPGSSIVVMLCQYRDDERLEESGWGQGAVVTYESLISALVQAIERLPEYRAKNPDAYALIKQVESFFIGGKGMATREQSQLFVDALCKSGAGYEFTAGSPDSFADKVREQAVQNFADGKKFLNDVKSKLRDHAERKLKPAILEKFDNVEVTKISIEYKGEFQWTVNIQTNLPSEAVRDEGMRGRLQFKFGPSAAKAIGNDKDWEDAWTGEGEPDYSKVFITWDWKIYQTDVTLAEVADGLSETDTRLVDQALEIISGSVSAY